MSNDLTKAVDSLIRSNIANLDPDWDLSDNEFLDSVKELIAMHTDLVNALPKKDLSYQPSAQSKDDFFKVKPRHKSKKRKEIANDSVEYYQRQHKKYEDRRKSRETN